MPGNMKIQCLQHVSFEGPAEIADWAAANGHELCCTHLYRGEKLPEMETFDCLLVMGGPMSVYDDRDIPWMREEKIFLEDAIERNKAILGVCLGAQLLANVLGANVYPNKEKEIGWFPIKLLPNPETERLFGRAGNETSVFHWHGDTFDLPEGAIHLAESVGCRNQAFVVGRRLIGLQFHLEMNQANIATITEECRNELVPGRFVQPADELLGTELQIASTRLMLWNLLDALESSMATTKPKSSLQLPHRH
jgi:GMP synthase-like glutamine amidotransferase